ncbi:MAG: tetratricopeptide repeat protein [Candidatus Omnitrophota bacterium]
MENNNNLQNNEFFQKAIALYRKKNYDYAIELFSQILKDNPDFEDCQRYLWDAIRQRNAALKKSFFAVIVQKINIFLLLIKFFVLDMNQNNSQALALIHKIILIDPNNIFALFKLASFQLKTNQSALATAALEQVLAIDKNNLPALKILADTYYTKKSYEKAKLMATKILELSPRYLPAENILNDISALGTIAKGFDEIKPAT